MTPFSTSLPSSQQLPQLFAIEPPTSSSRRPWVLDLQPPSLRSFTLHRPLPFASLLQTLLRLRFWRYHRDRLALIYKLVKASTPSETPLCAAQSFCMVDHTPYAPPRVVSSDHTPPRVITRPHALANVIHVSFCLRRCWRHLLVSAADVILWLWVFDRWLLKVDRWLWLGIDFDRWLFSKVFQSRFFLPSFSRRFHFAVCFCILCL